MSKACVRTLAGAFMLACIAGMAAQLIADDQPPALLILLDRDALDHGPPPHPIPGEYVNDLIAAVGVRDQLPYFRSNVGQPLSLLGGQNGSDGWFALTSVPGTWPSEPGADDGLQNYLFAGPGLGSPDAGGSRDSLLHSVPNVQPLRSEGLRLLSGRSVCAVVYDTDLVVADGAASLNGPNLGVVALKVLAVDNMDGSEWPRVEVQILDAKTVCGGPLAAFTDAPGTTP